MSALKSFTRFFRPTHFFQQTRFVNSKSAPIPPSTPPPSQDINYSSQAKQSEIDIKNEGQSSLAVSQNSIVNSNKNMVYCHALPNDWDEQKLKSFFDPTSKNIASVQLLKNRIGGYTGRALIQFKNSKICDQYLKKYGDHFIETTDVLQRIIMKPFELRTNKTRLQVEKTMKEVYLANLPYETTSDEIYALAQDFGEVLFIDMPLAFDGSKNRGYCIVRFAKADQAAKFQKYFESETLFGRKIRQRNCINIFSNFFNVSIRAQIYYYEFDTQKKRVERFSDKISKEDASIKNANINANKQLYKSLMSDNE